MKQDSESLELFFKNTLDSFARRETFGHPFALDRAQQPRDFGPGGDPAGDVMVSVVARLSVL